MAIQPVKRTKAYAEIVQQLSEMVRRGELQPGERLRPDRELATAFGVGRPTLRQALTVLTEAGVLEVRPGSGVYLRKAMSDASGQPGNPLEMVLMTENKSLRQILELRVGIEGEAAYLAALRRQGDHLAKLKAAMAALEEALVTRGVAIKEDYQFHYSVAEATGNPVFLKVMASLADLFLKGFRESTRYLYHEPDRTLSNRQEHQRILDAISEQRPDEARAAMVSHLKRVFDRIKQAEQLRSKESTDG